MQYRKGSKSDDSVLAQMGAVCARVLMRSGVPESTANRATVELVDVLRRDFGGWSIYIPKGRITKEERATEVHAQHAAGKTVAELADAYGFVPMYIYDLIAMEERRLRSIRGKAEATARHQRTRDHR